MAQAGFGGLSEGVLLGLEKALTEGAWTAVEADEWQPRKSGKVRPLDEAPVLVFHKVVLLGAVNALAEALGATADKIKSLDADWDEEQRTVDLELQLRERKKQPAPVREAAARVRAALLSAGTDQINYSYDKEVEFGRKQVLTAQTRELKADLTLLELGDVVTSITTATEALAVGISYDDPNKSTLPPARRVLAAQRRVAAACNAAYDSLSELIDRSAPGTPRAATLNALKGTLDALLARREAAPAAVKTPDAPPPVTPPVRPA